MQTANYLGSGDTKFDTMDDFIGGTLFALATVNIVDFPGGPIKKTVKAGEKIGVIDSYVTRPDGNYWLLVGGDAVKHAQGLFDFNALKNSILKNEQLRAEQIKQETSKRIAANTNPLYNIGETIKGFGTGFKWFLIALAVVIIIAVFLRIKK